MWSTVGVDRNALQNTAPEILDLSDHRSSQKARFGGEFLPSVTEVASGQLADQLGVAEQQVQRYESSAYRSASLARLCYIADVLGVTFTGRGELQDPVHVA